MSNPAGFGAAESLKRAREKQRRLYEAGVKPPSNPEERFRRIKHPPGSKPYMRLAIAANCYECVGREPSYRRLIAECEIGGCSLYTLRPYRPKEGGR